MHKQLQADAQTAGTYGVVSLYWSKYGDQVMNKKLLKQKITIHDVSTPHHTKTGP